MFENKRNCTTLTLETLESRLVPSAAGLYHGGPTFPVASHVSTAPAAPQILYHQAAAANGSLLVGGASAGTFQATNNSAVLEQGVLQYAESHMGQQVGDGQCSSLADAALKSVGTERNPNLPANQSPNGNYVWGKQIYKVVVTPAHCAKVNGKWVTVPAHRSAVGSPNSIHPGDIIQFRNVVTFTSNPDGSWQSDTFDHHTAIVESNNNGQLTILQQNYNGNMTVQQGTLDLSSIQQGTLWVYQPVGK